jgi:hypothetical protein
MSGVLNLLKGLGLDGRPKESWVIFSDCRNSEQSPTLCSCIVAALSYKPRWEPLEPFIQDFADRARRHTRQADIRLFLPKMLSGANAFEISDIDERMNIGAGSTGDTSFPTCPKTDSLTVPPESQRMPDLSSHNTRRGTIRLMPMRAF